MTGISFYFFDLIRRYNSEEDGLALTEYLVLLGLLTAALIAAIIAFGGALTTTWGTWTTWIGTNLTSP